VSVKNKAAVHPVLGHHLRSLHAIPSSAPRCRSAQGHHPLASTRATTSCRRRPWPSSAAGRSPPLAPPGPPRRAPPRRCSPAPRLAHLPLSRTKPGCSAARNKPARAAPTSSRCTPSTTPPPLATTRRARTRPAAPLHLAKHQAPAVPPPEQPPRLNQLPLARDHARHISSASAPPATCSLRPPGPWSRSIPWSARACSPAPSSALHCSPQTRRAQAL
jgi:hypothetical protein